MSKRQTTLFRRMKSAKESLTKTKKALDTMLLHKLHSAGVYTLDQFDKAYVSKKKAQQSYRNLDKKAGLQNANR